MIFEKGILGGITQVGKHYAKVDDKYMKEQYNGENENQNGGKTSTKF